LSVSGKAKRLTGVSPTDNVRPFNVVPVDCFDVAMIDHLGPVLAKYLASVRVYF
jgi:hypothetical protein